MHSVIKLESYNIVEYREVELVGGKGNESSGAFEIL